jgi:hypothetical protein
MRLLLKTIAVLVLVGTSAPLAQADGGPIMPLSQVKAGMKCTGYTVVQGTTISPFEVDIEGVVSQPGEGARILIKVSGPAVTPSGIAAGFSGSPIYCKGPKGVQENIGAVSEGVGQYGNNVGLATPIQQMLGEPVRPPSGAPKMTARTRQLNGPLTVSGLSPVLMSVLQKAGRRAGRVIVPAYGGPAPDMTPTPLVPGASVGVSYSTGVLGIGAVGTVTYRDGNDLYAFGHPLDGAGRRSLFLQDAYVYGVISNPDPVLGGSYKLAVPGQTVGTLTSDTPNAVIGVVGQGPSQTPITVRARDLQTGKTIVERTNVADESGVGYPLGGSLLDLIAPIAAGQAAIDVYNGPPASESGTMCLHVRLVEGDTGLHFCNRYVGIGSAGDMGYGPPEVSMGASNDVGNAMALLDSVQFATLHVKSIRITIDASRGLDEAMVLSAKGPKKVKPGQRVTARLKLQLYRQGTKTIRVKFRIPSDASGTLPVNISGPFVPLSSLGAGGVAGLIDILTGSLGGLEPGSSGAPTNLAKLTKQFAKIPAYDGLEARIGHGKPVHLYRDPKLVITGNATLKFRVVGGKAAPVTSKGSGSGSGSSGSSGSGKSSRFSGGFSG